MCVLKTYVAQGKSIFGIIFISTIILKFISWDLSHEVYLMILPHDLSHEILITQVWQDCLRRFNQLLCDGFLKADTRASPVLQGALSLEAVSGLFIFYWEWTATCFKVTRSAIPSLQLLGAPCIKHVCSGFVWDGECVTLQRRNDDCSETEIFSLL